MPAEDVAVATALAAGVGTLPDGAVGALSVRDGARHGAQRVTSPTAWSPGLGAHLAGGAGRDLRAGCALPCPRGRRCAARLVLQAIPATVRHAAMAGIGLFLAFIGLHNGGLVAPNPATLVELGNVKSPAALLTLGGILLVAVLQCAGCRTRS